MIRKTSSGLVVLSEKGKRMSKPDLTKQEAEHRIRQIEHYKRLRRKK